MAAASARIPLDTNPRIEYGPNRPAHRGASSGDEPQDGAGRGARGRFVTRSREALAKPSSGSKTGCLQWLHAAATKDGGSRPDQGTHRVPLPPGSTAPGTEIAAGGAPRGAPSPFHMAKGARLASVPGGFASRSRGLRQAPRVFRRSAPLKGSRDGKRANPAPTKATGAAERWLNVFRHSGARAQKRVYARLRRAMRANPESRRKHGVWFWIPGPALTRRPGMTKGYTCCPPLMWISAPFT